MPFLLGGAARWRNLFHTLRDEKASSRISAPYYSYQICSGLIALCTILLEQYFTPLAINVPLQYPIGVRPSEPSALR